MMADGRHVRAPMLDRSEAVIDQLRQCVGSTLAIEQLSTKPMHMPGSKKCLALWAALSFIIAILIIVPSLPVAIHEARLSLAVGSVSGVIGLALLQLGLL